MSNQESPVFTREQYERRWARVSAMLAENQLDAILVWSLLGPTFRENVEYLIGRHITNTLVFFPAQGDPIGLVQPHASVPLARRLSMIDMADGGDDYREAIAQVINSRGLQHGRIGLVEIDSRRTRGLPHLLVDHLRSTFPAAEFPTVTEEFELVRLQLAPEEQEWVDRAGQGLTRITDFLADYARPGVTAGELAAATERYAAENDLRLTRLSIRAGSMLPDDTTDRSFRPDRALQAGDAVTFESAALYGPYRAYRAFPITLGDPPPAYRHLFEAAVEAPKRCAAALRPGNRPADVEAVGEWVREQGVKTNGPLAFAMVGGFLMICQRGFDAYRPPRDITFQPGMSFQNNPHLCTDDGWLTAHIGDTAVVTDGAARLTGGREFGYVIK